MSVFYSFHYDRDNWRVQQVLNMGLLDGQASLNHQEWEAVKKKGNQAIENWIAEQMNYKTAVVVLIGAETASRPWVEYEIAKAWNDKRRLVGIRINGLADSSGHTDSQGPNPFDRVKFPSGASVAKYVPVYTPSGSTSKDVYASIHANLTTWVDSGYKPS